LEDRPGAAQTAVLAAQQIGIQAIYLILPGLVAAQFGLLPIDALNFVGLSVATLGVAGLLQILTRGPIGSGYPVAAIPTPIVVAVYLAASPSASLAVVSAATVLTGLLGMVLAGTLRRLQKLVPTEVAGVVVLLIGVSLLPRAFAAMGDRRDESVLALATLLVMMAVALKGGHFARFAVLVGAGVGTVAALAQGIGLGDGSLLQAAPWFAPPRPSLPDFGALDPALLPPFIVALLACFASWTGDLVAFQRAADGGWRRPDTPPIRRGLLAYGATMTLAGLAGAVPGGSSSACVGLTISTRVLARRVALWGSVALLILACCPKLLALALAVPEPVKAAMLLYVCCFMIAAGCQLMGSRMLDTRRTFTVGLGVALGLATLLDLPLLRQVLPPMLLAPVTAGALAAILLNLLTAPLVAQRATFTITPGANQALLDQVEALGGGWGARRETMGHIGHALLELTELLSERGVTAMRVQAHYATDRILVAVAWAGAPLPRPAARPSAEDLDGPAAAQEAFALWLATRQAETVDQRSLPDGGQELRLTFAD
jgi:NCS2 family nucleobase:cation symporter-2